MGCGFVAVVGAEHTAAATSILAGHHPGSRRIGTVTDTPGCDRRRPQLPLVGLVGLRRGHRLALGMLVAHLGDVLVELACRGAPDPRSRAPAPRARSSQAGATHPLTSHAPRASRAGTRASRRGARPRARRSPRPAAARPPRAAPAPRAALPPGESSIARWYAGQAGDLQEAGPSADICPDPAPMTQGERMKRPSRCTPASSARRMTTTRRNREAAEGMVAGPGYAEGSSASGLSSAVDRQRAPAPASGHHRRARPRDADPGLRLLRRRAASWRRWRGLGFENVDGVDISQSMLDHAAASPALRNSRFLAHQRPRRRRRARGPLRPRVFADLPQPHLDAPDADRHHPLDRSRVVKPGGTAVLELLYYPSIRSSQIPLPHVPWDQNRTSTGTNSAADVWLTPRHARRAHRRHAARVPRPGTARHRAVGRTSPSPPTTRNTPSGTTSCSPPARSVARWASS